MRKEEHYPIYCLGKMYDAMMLFKPASNKIVTRFYETRLCRSVGERLKFLSPQQATGYFGIFATTLRVEPSHFRFEKDFNFYLNSSRAASSGEFKFKDYKDSH